MKRISMTLPLLNQARCIVFLITGKEKAKTVQTVLEDSKIRIARTENQTAEWHVNMAVGSPSSLFIVRRSASLAQPHQLLRVGSEYALPVLL